MGRFESKYLLNNGHLNLSKAIKDGLFEKKSDDLYVFNKIKAGINPNSLDDLAFDSHLSIFGGLKESTQAPNRTMFFESVGSYTYIGIYDLDKYLILSRVIYSGRKKPQRYKS